MTDWHRLSTKKTCRACGSTRIRQVAHDLGYTSARELGRPAGAKGRDEFVCYLSCEDCGGVDIVDTPSPCFICGKDPDEAVDLCHFCEEVTGLYEWVPGLPNTVNLCEQPKCREVLASRVKKIMAEAFFE